MVYLPLPLTMREEERNMVMDFMKKPIAAAIRTEKDFSKALRSDVDMVFLLHSNIMTVNQQGVDGVLTTRTNIVKLAKEFDLITVQRFFMVDSHSVGTSVESIKISKPDIIEIMPGIITKKIREFSEKVDMPIIAGGIVETMEEVRAALEAGATVVSTGEAQLWTTKV